MLTSKGRFIANNITEQGDIVNNTVTSFGEYIIGIIINLIGTTCSVSSGYYTEVKVLTLVAPTIGSTIYYSINGQSTETYTSPITLNNDTIFEFWSVSEFGVEELHRIYTYVIDINPCSVAVFPREGTYTLNIVKFKLSKPGKIYWSYKVDQQYIGNPYDSNPYSGTYELNGSIWTEFTELVEQQFTLDKSIDILYYIISEGRTYPIQSLSYTYDPNAHTVSIRPSPISVFRTPVFIATLESSYEQ